MCFVTNIEPGFHLLPFNSRFTASIAFHGVLHVFQESCGTGTSSLESKLIQKLTDMREEVLYTIFLDLHKAYDALDSEIFLQTLEGYGVEPRARSILHTYWDRLRMVARAGGYYGSAFQGFWGVTQGDLLSPTIFNMEVGALMCHWISLVSGGSGVKYRWVREVLHRTNFYYADDGLVTSTDPVWLQGAFDKLTGLFDRSGLWKNVWKIVVTIFRPCCTVGTH